MIFLLLGSWGDVAARAKRVILLSLARQDIVTRVRDAMPAKDARDPQDVDAMRKGAARGLPSADDALRKIGE